MIPERYKKLGFTKVGQKKKSTRDGKKWMVLAEKGGKYKVVYGGAEGMSDYTKHKDSERRDRFWKRHNAGSPGKSKDPFSPLYWHKKFGTWALGGDVDEHSEYGDVWDVEDPKYKNGKWSLGDFIGPPTEEEYEASKPSFMISGVEGPSESRYSKWEKTGNIDFNPAFKAFNTLAQLITGTSTAFNDAKNRKEEERRHLESLIKKPRQNYNEDGLNNIPMYLTGGISPSLSELEQGEVFKDFDNNVIKVPDNLPTHEDGGVIVNNAHKILEDTSDKRNDIISKNLKMSVDDVFNLTGVKVKRPMTHSKAFEKASEHYDSKFNKMEKNIEKNLEHAKKSDSTFSKNSLDFNMTELESIPNKEDLFEALFSHQEAVKRNMLLNNTEIFQNGGKKKSPYKELPEGYGDENRKVDYIKAYNDYHGTNFTTISEVQNHRVSVHPFLGFYNNLKQVLDYYRNQGTPPTNKHTKVFGENEIDFTSADNEATNPDDGTPVQIKELDYTTTSDKKKDKFKQDLQWYDVVGALENLIDSDRIPVRYDAPDITFSGAKYINPNPQLQSATASYNTMIQRLPSTGVGFANMANIFSSKYNIDNQVLGQTENANNQIYNNQNRYEDQMRNAQSASDYQSRQLFEKKYLMSLENQRRQRALSKGDLYDTLAKNRRLNNEGDILMQMFDYFNQYGEYNNNPYQFVQRSSSDNTVMTDNSGRKYYVDPTTKKITKLTK